MKYRADIDGLRGISILAVVLFHAFPITFFYGYLGVDIFFVISGYLITQIIINEVSTNSFSYLHFYTRRIKRILPPALLIQVVVLFLGLTTLHLDELENLKKYIQASALFYTNYQLMFDIGYFDLNNMYKPLMHFWSLAVEEQFYVIWPVLIVLFFKNNVFKKFKAFIGLIAFCVTMSFSLYLFSQVETNPSSYFSLFSRMWQLMLGALVAFVVSSKPDHLITKNQTLSSVLAWLGFFFLAGAVLSEKFWAAVLVTIGAALIIAAGEKATFNRLLRFKGLVWLGLISYSLYLWHWPLLSFLRIYNVTLSIQATVITVFVSVALSTLTYFLIEKPLRNQNWHIDHHEIKRIGSHEVQKLWKPISLLALCFLIFIVGFFIRPIFKESNTTLTAGAALAEDQLETQSPCFIDNPQDLAFCKTSKSPSARKKALVVGDSHAHSLFPGLVKSMTEIKWYLVAHHSCDGLFVNKSLQTLDACQQEIVGALSKASAEKFDYVFFVNAHRVFEASIASSENINLEFFKSIILKHKENSTQFILLKPVPEMNDGINACTKKRIQIIQSFLTRPAFCETPLATWKSKSNHFSETLDLLAQENPQNILVFDQADVICENDICSVHNNSIIKYYDKDHLSVGGAELVGQYLKKNLNL